MILTNNTDNDQENSPEDLPFLRKIELSDPLIHIGEAARILNLSESALRKYEAAGLVIFHRSESNRRILSQEDIERIKHIRSLINKEGLNIQSILRLWSLIPCWELKDCLPEAREKCEAISDYKRPCWVALRNQGCSKISSCSECAVYRFSAYCTGDLKSLYYQKFRLVQRIQTDNGRRDLS
ncbi:MAG: MerR family transcriptional regulator [Calditrichaeota bacterium]|nr:MerR family transcriptional regulator [Calditrichota bacterium]